MNRTLLGTAAAALTAGLLVAGAGVAAADPTPPPPDSITLSPEQSRWLCEQRIPTLLDRIDRLETRIGGDADTPGSTAWLQERVDRARGNGRDALADRLQQRLDGRPDVAERLAGAERRVVAFRDEKCA
ncbi:hypothetical protein BJF78_15820 [Pseudonocardia sp. CNS-139]|nr:hypothetical protein BJF78_15820 [Pseudonocardia sp. CNS-139]